GDHRVEPGALGAAEGDGAVFGFLHGIAGRGEGEGHHLAHRRRVVHHQDSSAHATFSTEFDSSGVASRPRVWRTPSRRAASRKVSVASSKTVAWPAWRRARTKAHSTWMAAVCTRPTWLASTRNAPFRPRCGARCCFSSLVDSMPRSCASATVLIVAPERRYWTR